MGPTLFAFPLSGITVLCGRLSSGSRSLFGMFVQLLGGLRWGINQVPLALSSLEATTSILFCIYEGTFGR